MRELGLVFANEWMKLIHRLRFWIALGVGALLVIAFSALQYNDYTYMKESTSIEGKKQMIQMDQKHLQELQKELQAGTRNKQEIQAEIQSVQNSIKAWQEELKENEEFIRDWKKTLQARIAGRKAELQAPESFPGSEEEARAEIQKLEYQLGKTERPLAEWETSAYRQIEDVLGLMSKIFLPMLVIVFVADQVSGEATSGTIKLLLVRPVSRIKILLGKWLVSLTATVILVLSICALLWIINLLIYGTGGTNDPVYVGASYTFEEYKPEGSNETQTVPVADYSESRLIETWESALWGSLLLIYPMLTVATIAFMFSTLFHSAMVSTLCSLVIVVVGSTALEIVSGGKYISWLFSVHFNLLANWKGELSMALQNNLSLTYGMVTLTLWSVIALAIALYTFHRKDIYNT